MYEAFSSQQQQPTVVSIDPGDEDSVKVIKRLIVDMVQYNSEDRLPISEVVLRLKDFIPGTTLNIYFLNYEVLL